MSKSSETNVLHTPFEHRINSGIDGQFMNPHDAFNPSLERAAAIADLLQVACSLDTGDAFEPDTLWRAAQAIRFEIKDAQKILSVYFENEKSGGES